MDKGIGGLMRYAITICYDGEAYYGFQRQEGLPTIQQKLEEAISTKLNKPTEIVASGRTDAGVHALGQVAHFDSDVELDCDNFGYSVNTLLPHDIAIVGCRKLRDDFHARFDAVSKTYRYRIILSKIHRPIERRYFHICFYDLDIDKMREACKYLIGEHDFRSFMLTDNTKENTVRTIYDLHIECDEDKGIIDVVVKGNGFLHNMVRNIAGTLVDVGRGRFSPEQVEDILKAQKRSAAGKTLEGKALYLESVEYENF